MIDYIKHNEYYSSNLMSLGKKGSLFNDAVEDLCIVTDLTCLIELPLRK